MWLMVLSLNFGIKSNNRGSKCFIVVVRLMFAFDRDVLLSTCVFPEKLCFPCLIPGDAFLAVSLHFLRRAGDREVQRMGRKWGDTRPALLEDLLFPGGPCRPGAEGRSVLAHALSCLYWTSPTSCLTVGLSTAEGGVGFSRMLVHLPEGSALLLRHIQMLRSMK